MAKGQRKFVDLPDHAGRIFAVGDIHGCAEELAGLLDFVSDDQKPGDQDLVVFIGDYIDRGPESKEVVDLLLAFEQACPARVLFLRGNHEDMLLGFLGFDGTLGSSFLVNGGIETLASYGLPLGASADVALQEFPKQHLEFFRKLDRYAIVGKYVFAHAGLNPLRDLRFQLDDDLYWIRDEFITNLHFFQKTVVFGHTPFQDVLFHLPYKIGIDTGLVYGSTLTCIELTQELVFQLERGESEVRVFNFADKGGIWPSIE